MKSKLINQRPKTYVLVMDSGDEVMEKLQKFAVANNMSAAEFKAIGAFSSTELGYFDFSIKDYKKIPINEQVEVLSLIGDIALKDNKPVVHAHAVVGKSDGTAHGGHVIKAIVKPTLEVVLMEAPAHLKRKMNEDIGIPLIDLDAR